MCRDRVQQWADDVATNGDVHMEAWFQEIELVRHSAAWLLGADPKEIAFLKSTSDGIALVAEGFPWRPGDNLVLPEGEYPANVYPWLHLEEKGVRVKTVPCRDTRVAIEDVAAAIDAATRLLSVSFVQFATGFRSDLTALGNLCQARQIDFCVDAIQGLGVFPIDVRAMHIDYLSANSHKWLISPQGASIFYINQAKLDKIRPNSVGWKSVADPHSYSRLDYRLKDDASRFESGTFIVASIVGLGAEFVPTRRSRHLEDQHPGESRYRLSDRAPPGDWRSDRQLAATRGMVGNCIVHPTRSRPYPGGPTVPGKERNHQQPGRTPTCQPSFLQQL